MITRKKNDTPSRFRFSQTVNLSLFPPPPPRLSLCVSLCLSLYLNLSFFLFLSPHLSLFLALYLCLCQRVNICLLSIIIYLFLRVSILPSLSPSAFHSHLSFYLCLSPPKHHLPAWLALGDHSSLGGRSRGDHQSAGFRLTTGHGAVWSNTAHWTNTLVS